MNHIPSPSVQPLEIPFGNSMEQLACAIASSEPSHPLVRQQAIVAMGRRTVAPPPREILLGDAGKLLAELLECESYLVAERVAADDRLRLVLTSTSASRDGAFAHTREFSADGRQSLIGYVLERAHPVAITDLAQERRFEDRWLLAQGITSALAVPLSLPDRSFGALAACRRRSREFRPEDVLFAETISHLLTAAIARSEAESALETQRRLADGVLAAVDAMVLVLDSTGRIRQANQACQRLSGFSCAELQGRPIWEALCLPEEAAVFRLILERLGEGISPVECASRLLTKHSEPRQIAWTCSSIEDSPGGERTLLVTGVDVTEARQATRRSAEAEVSPAVRAEPEERSGTAFRSPSASNQERRRRPRRSYPYCQMIAPVVGEQMPPPAAFLEIRCNDISAGGFSYLAAKPPESNVLIVALGVPPKLTYLRAEVAHVNRVKQGEETAYLIGCTYTGRVPYGETPVHQAQPAVDKPFRADGGNFRDRFGEGQL